jgi:Dipeptidyl aminopeptidases/acylaminoacyl-peptidases
MEQFNPKGEKISYGGASFSRNGEGIYYSSDEGTEFRHLRYYDIKKDKHTILTENIPWDVSNFTQSDDGKLLAFTTNENAITKLRVVKTFGFREIRIPKLPYGNISGLKFDPSGSKIALNINSSKTPGDVYVLNLISGKLIQWTKSEVGGLNTESFVDTELIEINSFDGLNVSGFLYKPDSPGPHPVVVYIHGGPESQFRPGFSSTFQYWVKELGVAILATNVRGSSGFGKSFVKLDNGFFRENSC